MEDHDGREASSMSSDTTPRAEAIALAKQTLADMRPQDHDVYDYIRRSTITKLCDAVLSAPDSDGAASGSTSPDPAREPDETEAPHPDREPDGDEIEAWIREVSDLYEEGRGYVLVGRHFDNTVSIMRRHRDRADAAERERDEARAELGALRLKPAEAETTDLPSWDDLMKWFDTYYPESTFPTLPDDPKRDSGARIVSLIRQLAASRTELETARSENKRHMEVWDHISDTYVSYDKYGAEEGVRGCVDRMAKERDEARAELAALRAAKPAPTSERVAELRELLLSNTMNSRFYRPALDELCALASRAALAANGGEHDEAKQLEVRQMLRDLLAVVHRDGGHYTAKHGFKKSTRDAMEAVAASRAETEAAQESARKLAVEELSKMRDRMMADWSSSIERKKAFDVNTSDRAYWQGCADAVGTWIEHIRVGIEAIDSQAEPMPAADAAECEGDERLRKEIADMIEAPYDSQWWSESAEKCIKMLAERALAQRGGR